MATPTLYSIDEFSDLKADACLLDDDFNLVFISIWGRDTSIQQLIGKLALGHKKGGIAQFHLVADKHSIPVDVGDAENLCKQSARTFRKTLFGTMTNLWLYHKLAAEPDRANGKAFALLPGGIADEKDRLWPLVQSCCGLPLLPHWKEQVLAMLQDEKMLKRLPGAYGPVQGFRLAIQLALLEERISQSIRMGLLRIETNAGQQDLPLRLAA